MPRCVADSVLVALSSSSMVAPNFWLDPANNVSYPLVVQTPNYKVDSMDALASVPLTGKTEGKNRQLLMNVADTRRSSMPMVLSQLNIRSVYDIHADAQGRDLGSVAAGIDRIVDADQPEASKGVKVLVSGQIETMRDSFKGLAGGIGLAVVLVYLLMVINFQSWRDPLIVLMAVPLR